MGCCYQKGKGVTKLICTILTEQQQKKTACPYQRFCGACGHYLSTDTTKCTIKPLNP